jgi:hypothetical protein
MNKVYILLFSFFCVLTSINGQDIVHYWHFNEANGTLDTVYADYFNGETPSYILYRKIDESGDDTGIMDDVAGSEVNARNGYPAGNGIRPRNPSFNGELLITLNSGGYENLKLSYAAQRSGSGMLKQVLYYTTDGGENWTQHGDTVFVTTDYELAQFDFTGVSGVDNNADFAAKLIFLEQNVASNGNNRIDNVVLEGDEVVIVESELIHYWHFNNASGTLDTVYADYFNGEDPSYILYRKIDEAGDDIGIMDDVAGADVNARNGYEAGNGIRPRNPSFNGELLITLNSAGYENLKLSYAAQRSGQGMLKQVLYYTTDGGENWTQHGDTVFVTTDYELAQFDFTGVPGVDNNADFAAKLIFLEQNVASNGNNRIDNVVLEGESLGGAVEGVSVNPNVLTLSIGEQSTLNANVLPGSATNRNVSWSSSDEGVATVDENGVVTAIVSGNADIIVTTEDGGFEDTCRVTVLAPFTVEILVSGNSEVIEGAVVTLGGESIESDGNGIAVFERLAGSYTLNISAEGFVSLNDVLEVDSDIRFEYDLTPLSNTLVHYWHFNQLLPGTVEVVPADYSILEGDKPTIYYDFLPEYVEDPTMTVGYMDDFSPGSDLSAQLGEGPGAALRVRNRSEGRTLVIELPTVNCSNILLGFDVHRSGQGMLVNHFEYTLDGENFTNEAIVPQNISINADYNAHIIDLTNVEGANFNPNFAVRIKFEGNTNQGNGNNRYDNVAMFANLSSNTQERLITGFKLHPNPAMDYIFAELPESFDPIESNYQIIDIQGRMLRSGKLPLNQNGINLQGLNSGMYFMIIHDGAQQAVERFIVK